MTAHGQEQEHGEAANEKRPEQPAAVSKPKRIRISKKKGKKEPEVQVTAPTESMHSAVVNAFAKGLSESEFPETQQYAKKLESALFETYPSEQGSASFSDVYLKRMRSLRNNIAMVAFYLNRHQTLQKSVPEEDIATLDKHILSRLCTCSIETLYTPEERSKIDDIRRELLEKRVTEGGMLCDTCGNVKKAYLNLNLAGLEENNQWTNMFEDNMCQCIE